jgi:hypothetical protein
MNLTAEQIQENWNTLISTIETNITGERKHKLLDFYNQYQERIMLMPAAHKKEYHNAFPGWLCRTRKSCCSLCSQTNGSCGQKKGQI